MRKEVLKDSHLSTVSDAILIAERINAAEKFADNFENYKSKNKKYKEKILNDYTQPMDLGNVQRTNGSKRGGFS